MDGQFKFEIFDIQNATVIQESQLPDVVFFQPPLLQVSKETLFQLCQEGRYSVLFYDSSANTITGTSGENLPQFEIPTLEDVVCKPSEIFSMEDDLSWLDDFISDDIKCTINDEKNYTDNNIQSIVADLMDVSHPIVFTAEEVEQELGKIPEFSDMATIETQVYSTVIMDKTSELDDCERDKIQNADFQLEHIILVQQNESSATSFQPDVCIMKSSPSHSPSFMASPVSKDVEDFSDLIILNPSLKLAINATEQLNNSLEESQSERSGCDKIEDKAESTSGYDSSCSPQTEGLSSDSSNSKSSDSVSPTSPVVDSDFAENDIADDPDYNPSQVRPRKAHKPRKTGIEKFPYVCDRCNGKRFKLKAYLLNHELTHLPEPVEVFACTYPKCTAVYQSKPALQTHFNRNHKPENIAKSTCPSCKRVYTNPSYLHNKHLKSCNPEIFKKLEAARLSGKDPLPLTCPRKRKSPTTAQNKKLDGEFKCSHSGCSASYNTETKLLRHAASHRRIRLKCDYCVKDYAWHQQLINHIISKHAKEIYQKK